MSVNTYANWRVPEQLVGAAAAAARLSHNRPLPRPTWPGGDWGAFSSAAGTTNSGQAVAFGLRVGMVFQAKKLGYEPTGFGGPLSKGSTITIQNIICDPDDGCIVHWVERGGCTALGQPSLPGFRAGVRQFMGALKYIPTAVDADGLHVGDRVRIKKSGALGWVEFVGSCFFEPGLWIGVDLESVEGRNNGSITKDGRTVVYFKARRSNSGLFVRPDAVARLSSTADSTLAVVDGDQAATASAAAAAERSERRAALLVAVRQVRARTPRHYQLQLRALAPAAVGLSCCLPSCHHPVSTAHTHMSLS